MKPVVIFDFDGVIADTMQDNLHAWRKAFDPYNVTVDTLEYFLLEGMGRKQIAAHFLKENGLSTAYAPSVAEQKEILYKQNNNFRIFEGVRKLLQLLQAKNMDIGLVTGASRNRIEVSLDAELKHFFKAIVTVDDVQQGKPHPEPYTKAMAMMGASPAQTIVVENARFGIESAKAAGCICFALETTVSKEYLSQADKIFATHSELFDYFEKN